jgi:hypothetical protein
MLYTLCMRWCWHGCRGVCDGPAHASAEWWRDDRRDSVYADNGVAAAGRRSAAALISDGDFVPITKVWLLESAWRERRIGVTVTVRQARTVLEYAHMLPHIRSNFNPGSAAFENTRESFGPPGLKLPQSERQSTSSLRRSGSCADMSVASASLSRTGRPQVVNLFFFGGVTML